MSVITQVFLPLSLAVIMFSMGLTLTGADFKRVFVQPRAFAIGAFLQIVTLPLIAFGIASTMDMRPEFAVGLMILAACPGGVTSNLLTYLARGDAALSVSLTAVISILSAFTLPPIVNFGLSEFAGEGARSLPVVEAIGKVLLITTAPLLIGMFVNHKAPARAKKIEPILRKVAAILFVIIVLGAIAKERQNLVTYFGELGPSTLALNIATMAFAFFVALSAKLDSGQRIAITLECGLQNGTLAIMVATTLLENEMMMLPGGVYSILMFATATLFIFAVARRGDDKPAPAAA